MIRDTTSEISGVDHFLNRPVRVRAGWLVWFVFIGGAMVLGGFLALLARSNGLI